MDEQQWNNYKAASLKGTLPDNENPIFAFSMTSTKILTQLLNGELDAAELMKAELRSRGYDEKGNWVGFHRK